MILYLKSISNCESCKLRR